jgi:hypothetical protein
LVSSQGYGFKTSNEFLKNIIGPFELGGAFAPKDFS